MVAELELNTNLDDQDRPPPASCFLTLRHTSDDVLADLVELGAVPTTLPPGDYQSFVVRSGDNDADDLAKGKRFALYRFRGSPDTVEKMIRRKYDKHLTRRRCSIFISVVSATTALVQTWIDAR